MSSERTLIASVMFLSIGLGLIFGYCHGTAGFNAGYPLSGTSLQFSINTTGIPALAGGAATLLGILLLATAFVQAILGQVRWAVEHPRRSSLALKWPKALSVLTRVRTPP